MNEIRNLDTRSQLEQNIRQSVFRFPDYISCLRGGDNEGWFPKQTLKNDRRGEYSLTWELRQWLSLVARELVLRPVPSQEKKDQLIQIQII